MEIKPGNMKGAKKIIFQKLDQRMMDEKRGKQSYETVAKCVAMVKF